MDRDLAKDFLGVGWKFPIEVDEITGRMKTSTYEEDIEEAIKIILRTKKGERVMLPEFGCLLSEYIFETLDYATCVRLQKDITDALVRWEPRITDVDVTVEPIFGVSQRVDILIQYVVRATNNPYNLVYPYYMNEGMA